MNFSFKSWREINFLWIRNYMTILNDEIPKNYLKTIWQFSRIQIEHGEIQSVSPYSVQIQENTDQKISEYVHFSRSGKQIQGRLPIETSYWDKISKKKTNKTKQILKLYIPTWKLVPDTSRENSCDKAWNYFYFELIVLLIIHDLFLLSKSVWWTIFAETGCKSIKYTSQKEVKDFLLILETSNNFFLSVFTN